MEAPSSLSHLGPQNEMEAIRQISVNTLLFWSKGFFILQNKVDDFPTKYVPSSKLT